MRYLLDANAVIALLNDTTSPIARRVRRHRPRDFAVSAVVIHELYYGAFKSQRVEQNVARVDALQFSVLELDEEDARQAGQIRAHLASKGTPIGPYDVLIAGQAMATDLPSSFEERSCIKMVGFDMTRKASRKVYEQSGLGPEDVDVVELHDCFSCNELITYEGLGLCPEGKGGEFVDSGANTYGGKVVVNPSGGLISKGHPLGATGLAQCSELVWQLRGEAEKRQVQGAEVALQHNLGLGGAAVVTMYRKPQWS